MNEYDFSQTLRDKLPGYSMRIENAISAGTPDIVLIHERRTYWIETKMGPSVRLRPYQLATFIQMLSKGGVRVLVMAYNKGDVDVHITGVFKYRFQSTHHLIISPPSFKIPLRQIGVQICGVLEFLDKVL